MDFDDSPEDVCYRVAARTWLTANAPPAGAGPIYGSDQELVAAAQAWQSLKAGAGYAAITLPTAWGGAGLSPNEAVIFRQEQARCDVPFGVFEITLGMCVPALAALGSDMIKQRYIRPAVDGREIWCQLFSEPGAGSDLAALATRAVRSGKGWVINGQKVWTTGAQFSDFGLLLARSDSGAAKHAGLTLFVVDMRAPGVEVHPIRQLSGECEFNEVFFRDVFIPDDHRLTEPGGGWAGARMTLSFERLNVGGEIGLIDSGRMVKLARELGLAEDTAVLERLARWYVGDRGCQLFNYATVSRMKRDVTPGPEQSLVKLVLAVQAQEMGEFARDLLGVHGALTSADFGPDRAGIERAWSMGAGMRIAGGTDEILRNVIAERVLGLPVEPRFDRPPAV